MKLIITFLLALTTFCFSQDFWEKTEESFVHDISCLTINSNGDIFAGTLGGGLYHSTDNGDSWIQNDSLTGGVYCLAIKSNGDIFASFDGGVYLSIDNGDSWTQKSEGLPWGEILSLAINSNNGDIFAGFDNTWTAPGCVYRSTDNGENWTQINNGLTDLCVNSLAINSNGDIFAGTRYGGVFRSTDNGDNWTQLKDSLNVRILAINSNGDIFAVSSQGVYRTTDNGDNWTKLDLGGPFYSVNCLAINSSGDIFAGIMEMAGGKGVFYSANNGDNWIPVNEGLTELAVRCLAINSNGYIYAGTFDGDLFRSINTTVSVEDENILPSIFSLKQNYPNPFNPFTTINYSIPNQSFVTLKVFDVLGREVSTIVNKEQAQGNYKVEWNAANNSSGIYFYRIQAGDFVESKKMVLMK